jgi:hypothetical protein
MRVTIREAAARRARGGYQEALTTGSLGKEMGRDGRAYVYVYLGLSLDTSKPESQVHRDPMVKELVEELRDRVAFLERSPEQRSVEAERYQQIVAGLTQTNNQLSTRVLELEGPPPSPTSSWASDGTAQDVAEAAASPEAPRAAETSSESDPGTEEPPEMEWGGEKRERSWWRRMFGG